jgi:hypothetical protein
MGARVRFTPTTRSIAFLEARGWLVDIAERRQGPITRDLFGCIDLVAAHPTRREVLFVQVTDSTHLANRVTKTLAQPATLQLLRAGVRIEVWGWGNEASPRVRVLELPPPTTPTNP